jgi:hypothetical protein
MQVKEAQLKLSPQGLLSHKNPEITPEQAMQTPFTQEVDAQSPSEVQDSPSQKASLPQVPHFEFKQVLEAH